MKLRVRILAWLLISIGFVGLAISLFFLLPATSMAARDPAYEDELALVWGILGMASVSLILPLGVCGVGLLLRKRWARPLTWAVAAPLAAVIPVGTALSGFILWVLLTTIDLSADGGMARFEHAVRHWWRGIALILAGLFIFGVIILIGWLFRDQIDPPGHQVLTPLPSGVPPQIDRPDFKIPEFSPPDFSQPGPPGAPEQ